MEDLLARAVAGERAAFDAALRPQLGALRAYIRLRMGEFLGARESVSDLVQLACLTALEQLASWRPSTAEQLRICLFRAAEQRIVDRVRYHRAERRAAAGERLREHGDDDALHAELDACRSLVTPSRHASDREQIGRLRRALDQLPEDHRRVVLLSRLGGLDHAAIAREIGRSPHAVDHLISRALARLALALGRAG